jgi:mono/diheme cytochrome c family protein
VTRSAALVCALLVVALAGCGGEIEVSNDESASVKSGADLFYERCSGCHSLDAANSYGSKASGQLEGGEISNGPNFNIRKETKDDVLFAIRNGGFSGQIMPANIVVGEDAQKIAEFLAKYSGKESGGEDVTESGQSAQP